MSTAYLYTYECECVRLHNRYRARHWAQNLQWDESLAREARKWALHLQEGKIQPRHYESLEKMPKMNVFWTKDGDATCEEAVAEW